jgi:hypothetical protein
MIPFAFEAVQVQDLFADSRNDDASALCCIDSYACPPNPDPTGLRGLPITRELIHEGS